MPAAPSPNNQTNRIFLLLAVFFLCHLDLLVLAPHCDSSEFRYTEIARKMVKTGSFPNSTKLFVERSDTPVIARTAHRKTAPLG